MPRNEFFRDFIVTSPEGIWVDGRAYATLNAAVAAVGANEQTIVIASEQVITTITIPVNVTLKFERNGSISNSEAMIILTTKIIAPNRQIFTGVGNIAFSWGSELRSSWFASFEEAVTRIAHADVTLVVSEPRLVAADCTVGAYTSLKWESPNAMLTVNPGTTVDGLQHIEAGSFQLFAGAGTFTFDDHCQLKLSWFPRLRSALTWIDTSEVVLHIDGTHIVDFSDVAPYNISFDFKTARGHIEVLVGLTLVIKGDVYGGFFRIFSGDGTVICPRGFSVSAARMTGLLESTLDFGDTLRPWPGTVSLQGFAEPADGGGGEFHWDPLELKDNHDGGTIIDPHHTALPGAAAWYAGVGIGGVGCWKRNSNSAVDIKWFGATGDGVTDDTTAIQAALICARTGELFIPGGTYLYDDTLSLTAPAVIIGEGTNSILEFTDVTGKNAIEITTVADTYSTIRLTDFVLTGTATCGHGIVYNTASSSFNVTMENLKISDFTKVGSYALRLKKLYNSRFVNIKIHDCANGIYLDELVLYTIFHTVWIWDITRYSIHTAPTCTFLFMTFFVDTVISNTALAADQIGVMSEAPIYEDLNYLIFQNLHIEKVDIPFDCVSGSALVFKRANFVTVRIFQFRAGATYIFNDSTFPAMTNNPFFNNGALVTFKDCYSPIGYSWSFSLGTIWDNSVKFTITYPSYSFTAGDAPGFFIGANNLGASIVNVSNSSGTIVTTHGFAAAANIDHIDIITLRFSDDLFQLVGNGSAWFTNAFKLKTRKMWRPRSGDSITFKRGLIVGATKYWEEVERMNASVNQIAVATSPYSVYEGDHERVYTNTGATGAVTINLFDTTADTVGTKLTFVKTVAQDFFIDPYLAEVINGGGAGKYLILTNVGDSVTLYTASANRWEVLESFGVYTFEP